MTTVLEIITDALQDAGIISANETPNATDAQKAFRLLNRMLDTDSTEDLMIYNNVQEVFNFTSGQQSYTIGTGGNFNTTRPVDVTAAYVRDTNGNDIPVSVVDYETYSQIISKPIQATIPLAVYYNASYPLSTLTFWPIPTNTSYTFVLWSWKLLTSFTSLSDTVSMPPGYEQYIETNLAARICVAFNRPIPPELLAWATESKAALKRINVNVPTLSMPSGLTAGPGANTFPISPSVLTGF